MMKALLLCSCLLVLCGNLSLAEIYKCKDASGATVYTDDSTKLPQGCDTEHHIKLPQLNVMPGQVSQPETPGTTTSPPVPPDDAAQPNNTESAYAALKSEAVNLVESFDAARKSSFRAHQVSNKQKARQELSEIRTQKQSLLKKIEASQLPRPQKKEISERLSSITE